MQVRLIAGLALLLSTVGCDEPMDDGGEPSRNRDEAQQERIEEELEAVRARILARADSVRSALRQVPGLTARETGTLRRDVNREQIATARSFGERVGSRPVQQLAQQGKLVELEDSTKYWIVRELEHSVPYVTPDTRAMLLEIGERFHDRLERLGLPPYRMEITSVLRTPESQANLRRSNPNASRGVSAHEFGTTLDVAYMHFAPPADSALTVEVSSAPELTSFMKLVEGLVLRNVAQDHVGALQAELGRVLLEMRQEKKLQVMMERQQTVYHMTVARQFDESSAAN